MMIHYASFSTLFCFLFYITTLPATSNDSRIGGWGSDAVLLSEARIQMVSEDIHFTQTSNWSDWHVEAFYRFKNLTSDTITIHIGFPEKGDDCCANDPSFRNLLTFVRDHQVSYEIVQPVPDSLNFCVGPTYVFEATFLPDEEVEIKHRYDFTASQLIGTTEVEYLTRTGRLWSGTIDTARFTVVTFGRAGSLLYDKEYHLVDHYRDTVGSYAYAKSVAEFYSDDEESLSWLDLRPIRSVYVFEQHHWNPERDFSAIFEDSPLYIDKVCATRPYLYNDIRWDLKKFLALPSDTMLALLSCISDSILSTMRNAVYATYGRPFADPTLHQYFYQRREGLWWSQPGEDTTWVYFPYVLNSRYSDDLLTPLEREFVVVLKSIESQRKRRLLTAITEP